jgi:hypothetical protein
MAQLLKRVTDVGTRLTDQSKHESSLQVIQSSNTQAKSFLIFRQRRQDTLARVVTKTRLAEHFHPVLARLYWLSINYRIDYKVMATPA